VFGKRPPDLLEQLRLLVSGERFDAFVDLARQNEEDIQIAGGPIRGALPVRSDLDGHQGVERLVGIILREKGPSDPLGLAFCVEALGILKFQFTEKLFEMSDDVRPQGTPTFRSVPILRAPLHVATYKI
jgi:hypothetical protein